MSNELYAQTPTKVASLIAGRVAAHCPEDPGPEFDLCAYCRSLYVAVGEKCKNCGRKN